MRSSEETHPEHIANVDALEARGSDLAERAMIVHIRRTIALLHERIKEDNRT